MPAPSAAVVALLEQQLTHEWYAAQNYTSMAFWCENEHYNGFAEFFHHQAAEEREHAHKFMKHLVDRGVLPRVGALDAPRTDYKSLLEVAQMAQQMEIENTTGIHAAYAAALEQADFAAQPMLLWFINEQVEEEAWADQMVTKVQRATCPGALQYLDRHIMKELVGDKED